MNKYKLSIVIINYRTPQMTIDCLISLLPELEGISAKVIVVDNASNDDSCVEIQRWIDAEEVYEQVFLLSSPENLGFSGGNNLGIKHTEAEYYLLLNSDTLIQKKAISTLLNAADINDSVGLISPRLEWADGTPQESCFRFHSPLSELISSANTGFITRLFKQYQVPYPVSDVMQKYDWTSFACVLIKADVFNDIGLMDDGYFMYFEDVAFSYHAKQAGWDVMNVPSAHVVHLRGGSSPMKSLAKQRKRLPYYYYESRTRYFYQVYGAFGLLLANVSWTMGFVVSSLRSLVAATFQPNVSKNQWRDIWIGFFSPLRKYKHPNNY